MAKGFTHHLDLGTAFTSAAAPCLSHEFAPVLGHEERERQSRPSFPLHHSSVLATSGPGVITRDMRPFRPKHTTDVWANVPQSCTSASLLLFHLLFD